MVRHLCLLTKYVEFSSKKRSIASPCFCSSYGAKNVAMWPTSNMQCTSKGLNEGTNEIKSLEMPMIESCISIVHSNWQQWTRGFLYWQTLFRVVLKEQQELSPLIDCIYRSGLWWANIIHSNQWLIQLDNSMSIVRRLQYSSLLLRLRTTWSRYHKVERSYLGRNAP